MSVVPLFDAAGRRRSPATMPGYHAGREPRNKGRSCPADLPTVDEVVAVVRQAGEDRHGLRACAVIVVLWRAVLWIQEALLLTERGSGCESVCGAGAVWEGWAPSRGRDRCVGVERAAAVDGRTRAAAGRAVVLRDRWTDARGAAVVKPCRASRVPPPHKRRGAPPVRAAGSRRTSSATPTRSSSCAKGAAADPATPARASRPRLPLGCCEATVAITSATPIPDRYVLVVAILR